MQANVPDVRQTEATDFSENGEGEEWCQEAPK